LTSDFNNFTDQLHVSLLTTDQEILADFADVIEDTGKVGNQLGIALVEGIEFGRLRQVSQYHLMPRVLSL
jgi:hypothetical protein